MPTRGKLRGGTATARARAAITITAIEHRRGIQAHVERVQNSTKVRGGGAADPSSLRALHIVYEQLELQLMRSGALGHASLAQVSQRRQQLERELEDGQLDLHTVDKPALYALVLAQFVRREGTKEAVLAGVVQALDWAWELTREPTSKLLGSQPPTAISGIESFWSLLGLLEKQAPDRGQSLRALNFEAGTHPIPRDLREVEAALRAGERTYHEWQYYYARYGERGLRFTRSDSAWIAFVARSEEQLAQNMFDWLARLLAGRGMPRLLFEHHLVHLHAELVRALPDQAAEYASLLRAVARLEAARNGIVADFEALARHFQPLAGPTPPPLTAAESGRLLAAAVLDEKLGIANAVGSLVSWLGDATRFGDDWSRAVERFLQRARALI